MQFIIRSPLKEYDWKHEHTKVIVFDSEQDAYQFRDNFANFAMMQAMQAVLFDGGELLNDVQENMNSTVIIPLPDNYDKETINYSEIVK